MMIIFKNFFSFALTFKAYDWIIYGGIRPTLLAISSIQVGVCLLSIPMCKWYFFERVFSLPCLSTAAC